MPNERQIETREGIEDSEHKEDSKENEDKNCKTGLHIKPIKFDVCFDRLCVNKNVKIDIFVIKHDFLFGKTIPTICRIQFWAVLRLLSNNFYPLFKNSV